MQYNIFAGVMMPLILTPLLMVVYAAIRRQGESIMCMECQQCQAVCPVLKVADGYIGPKDIMVAAKSNKIDWAMKMKLEYCSTCGACIERCPRRLDPMGANMKMRVKPLTQALENPLVAILDKLPNPKMKNMVEAVARRFEKENINVPWPFITKAKRLRKHFNIVDDNFRKPTLEEQIDKAKQELEKLKEGLKYVPNTHHKNHKSRKHNYLPQRLVFFEGCTTARVNSSARLTTHLLLQKCVDHGIIKEYQTVRGERCCGVGSKILGDEANVDELINANIQVLERTGIKDIIYTCGDCTAAFGSGSAMQSRGFRSMNIIEFVYALTDLGYLDEIMDQKLAPETKMSAHFHCHLRRFAGIKMEDITPKVIHALGAKYVSMPANETCCGAGSEGLEQKMATKVVQSAEDVKADVVPMMCAGCEANMSAAASQNQLNVKFRSLQAMIALGFSDLQESIDKIEKSKQAIMESGKEFPDFSIKYTAKEEVSTPA